jgi:hypothetical protein
LNGGLGAATRLDKSGGHLERRPTPRKCGFRKVTAKTALRFRHLDQDKTDDRGNKSSSMSREGGIDTTD